MLLDESEQQTEGAPLPLEKALELFKQHVGGETIEAVDDIPEHVEMIKECNGLSLALQTVGQATAGKTSPEEWKHAIYLRISSFPSTAEKAHRD